MDTNLGRKAVSRMPISVALALGGLSILLATYAAVTLGTMREVGTLVRSTHEN